MSEEETPANGTKRVISGQRKVFYDGYWIKAYDAPADTLGAKKRLIEALTRRLFNHVEHGVNIPGMRLEEARRAFDGEENGQKKRVKAGMLAAHSDIIVFADADMATPPDQLPLLVDALETHDVALGSRIQADGSDMRASQPSYRRMLGKVFHFLASVWVVGPVKDTQCGFKGFRRDVAHDLFARQQITSIVFDVELIFLARKRGYSLAVIPIRWADKRGSRMVARFGLAIRVAWDLFRIPLVHRRVGRVAPAATHDEA